MSAILQAALEGRNQNFVGRKRKQKEKKLKKERKRKKKEGREERKKKKAENITIQTEDKLNAP